MFMSKPGVIDAALIGHIMRGADEGWALNTAWRREVERRIRAAERAGEPVDLPAILASVPLPANLL
jgi:hypothetical protein